MIMSPVWPLEIPLLGRLGLLSGVLAFCLALSPVAARATTVAPPTFTNLVNESDYIIRAVVKSVCAEVRVKNGKRKIYTSVELEVRETIAGTPPEHVVLVMLGGRVGDEELRVEGVPQFQVGDEDILFVKDNGRQFYPLTAIMHGKYPVLKELASGREYVARANKVPLTAADEVSLPMEGAASTMLQQAKSPAQALTPAQFITQIRAAAKSAQAPARLH